MSSAPMTPQAFARVVNGATDEQLAAGLAANRELILGQLFAQMPEYVDGSALGSLDAVVEWRVGDRPDGGVDRFQLRFSGGALTVEHEGSAEPRVALEIGGVDFVRLCADPARGPELFLYGRLRMTGDLVLGAQLPSLFTLPL